MRVLLCVDDDPVLDAVLATIDWFVETTKWDELLILHVVPKAPRLLTKPRAGVNAFLSSVVERRSHLPVTIETMVAAGDPAETIVRTADTNEVDLIVMGARGESHDFPVGSVSQKVAYLAATDVLVVRAGATSPGTTSSFQALITVDGSQGSEAGINSFANKLRARRANIHLVHVIESLPRLWEIGSEDEAVAAPLVRHAEQLLERAASLLAAHGLDTQREWRHGSPATTILDVARRRGSELIVVGSLGHKRLARLLLGPMTQRILRHAPCSVLCARAWSPERAALTSDWSSDNVEPQIGMA